MWLGLGRACAARQAVRGDVALAWDVDWREPVGQELHLLIVQAGICNVPKLCGVREDL